MSCKRDWITPIAIQARKDVHWFVRRQKVFKELVLVTFAAEKITKQVKISRALDEFHLRWLKIKEFDTAIRISITLFANHLN